MLCMRPEQMEVFNPVAEAAFVKRLADLLRARHGDVAVRRAEGTTPLRQLPDGVLRELVQRGIARAREYGLTWQSSIGGFVVLRFLMAPNFDAHPLVRRVLRDERIPADLRVDRLWRRTTRKTWEQIQERYDPNAWQG
jgi:hypothetical protein